MTSPRRPAPSSLAWWVRDRDGRLAVAQFPNAAILVWLLAFLARVADTGPVDEETLRAVGRGALLVWGLDELVRGASPVRRVLGAVVLAAQLAALLS